MSFEQADLEELVMNWSEDKSVGDIILKYVSVMEFWSFVTTVMATVWLLCNTSSFFLCQSGELVKAYPPFVNFFEMSKETIVKCEKQKPRFHAFLKVFCVCVCVGLCVHVCRVFVVLIMLITKTENLSLTFSHDRLNETK